MRQGDVLLVELPLEFGRRQVGQGRAPAMGVVETLQVLEDRCPGLEAGPEDVLIEQLALQGGEERLRDGVIKTIPATAQGRHDSCLLAATPKGKAGILAARSLLSGTTDDLASLI